jgi:hypothetical protein
VKEIQTHPIRLTTPSGHYAKRNQSVTKKQNCKSPLIWHTERVKFSERERGMVVARGWRQREMQSCLKSTELQFCKMKTVLEMYGTDGCTREGTYRHWTVKMVNYVMCI